MTHTLLRLVIDGGSLDAAQSAEAFNAIMRDEIAEDDLAAFLIAQAERVPTVEEIVGAARAMRAQMRTIKAPPGAIDLCGTGGDGHGTLNISTAVSFVVAGCGVPVAKHGNRSATSRSGAADVLESLGVRIDISPETAERCLAEAGLCFLFAQTHHPSMRHVAAVRKRIGRRTIFNLLGPLTNPASVTRQLLGVYARVWLEPLARVLLELGTERAWIVHGEDGLDEMTTTDASHVAMLNELKISTRQVLPEEIGAARATLADLKGGDVQFNAEALLRLLKGDNSGPYRDIVILNASAALVVADRVQSLSDGATLALDSIRDGRALATLNRLIETTHRA